MKTKTKKMKTITAPATILALLPDFSQTILEEGSNGETVEHGRLSMDGDAGKARVIYQLPKDGKYDQDSGEFLGDWNAHIVRMEIDADVIDWLETNTECSGEVVDHETCAILTRNPEGGWLLCRWKGDIFPSETFATEAEAREFAASKNYGVKRLPECDAI